MATINGMRNLHTITSRDNYDMPAVGEERSTCRRGTKWQDLPLDTEVILTIGESEFEREIVGRAIITGKTYLLFEDLRHEHFQHNHLRNCQQDSFILFEAMRKFYGDDFSWDSQVTVLFYRRIA